MASAPITLAFPTALSREDRKDVHETVGSGSFPNLTSKTVKLKVDVGLSRKYVETLGIAEAHSKI